MASNESKERLLVAAKDLFLARGYGATTVHAISAKAALSKASLYYFFDSKEELGLAVLEWSLRRSMQLLTEGPHALITDPVKRAFAFLKHLENCAPQLWSGGCLLGVFAQELAETNPRMQKAVAGMFQVVADEFAKNLQPIAARSSGKQTLKASELAETLLGTVEGSIILAKAQRDPTRLPKAVRGFRLSLATLASQSA